MKDLTLLERKIDTKFKNKDLLQEALIHRSYLNEHPEIKLPHNERLEFLGDAVLELIVTEYLYQKYNQPEGILTSWRASLVNTESLNKTAEKLNLNDFLYLSKGEQPITGKARKVILANALEAIIGAIYLDQGLEIVKKFIKRTLLVKLPKIIKYQKYKDPKSTFQEFSQAKFKITPLYKILEESGPAHDKTFVVGLFLNDKLISRGRGTSKQEAETKAAQVALKKYKIKP